MLRINFSVAVWGQEYTETFLDHVLPSFLSPGNFPYICKHSEGVEFYIYIGRSVETLFKRHPNFSRLTKIVPTKLLLIDDLEPHYLEKTVYESLNLCHRHFIEISNGQRAGMAFLSPDAIWSDGSFKELLEQAKAGKRALLIVGIRTIRESVLQELNRLPTQDRLKGQSSRRLTELAVKFPHKITESLCWDSCTFDRGWPSNLFWKVGNEGFLCRAFHLHTFYVHPRSHEMPAISHDLDWLSKLGFSDADVHVVQDSERLCCIELSPRNREIITKNRGPASIVRVAVWVYRHTMSDHRKYLFKPIVFYTGKTVWKWKMVELRSRMISFAILAVLPIIPAIIAMRKRILERKPVEETKI